MRFAPALAALVVASACGPAHDEGVPAATEEARGPIEEAPGADAAAETPGGASAQAVVAPLNEAERLALKVMNLYQGLVLLSYLDALQEADACERGVGSLCDALIHRRPSAPPTFDTSKGGRGLGRYLRVLEISPKRVQGRSLLADYFLRLASSPSGVDARSLLDIFNDLVGGVVEARLRAVDGRELTPDVYRAPITVVGSMGTVDVGSFPRWITAMRKFLTLGFVVETIQGRSAVERFAMNLLVDRMRDELLRLVFVDTGTLHWRVGADVLPLLEADGSSAGAQLRPRRIFIPTDGELRLRGTGPDFFSLNTLLDLQWQVFSRREGTFRVDRSLFEHNLMPPANTDAYLSLLYRELNELIRTRPLAGRLAGVLPVHRGSNPSGQQPGAPFVQRPFSHLYFVEGTAAQQRLLGQPRQSLNGALWAPIPADQELRRYLLFLSAHGARFVGPFQFPPDSGADFVGAASRDFRPGQILKSGVFLVQPESSALDSFLLTLVLYLTVATTTLDGS
jgi:hypothetical protein